MISLISSPPSIVFINSLSKLLITISSLRKILLVKLFFSVLIFSFLALLVKDSIRSRLLSRLGKAAGSVFCKSSKACSGSSAETRYWMLSINGTVSAVNKFNIAHRLLLFVTHCKIDSKLQMSEKERHCSLLQSSLEKSSSSPNKSLTESGLRGKSKSSADILSSISSSKLSSFMRFPSSFCLADSFSVFTSPRDNLSNFNSPEREWSSVKNEK